MNHYLDDLCETGNSSLILDSLLDFGGTRGLATFRFSSNISAAIIIKKKNINE
jgi:hypothetical protein